MALSKGRKVYAYFFGNMRKVWTSSERRKANGFGRKNIKNFGYGKCHRDNTSRKTKGEKSFCVLRLTLKKFF